MVYDEQGRLKWRKTNRAGLSGVKRTGLAYMVNIEQDRLKWRKTNRTGVNGAKRTGLA